MLISPPPFCLCVWGCVCVLKRVFFSNCWCKTVLISNMFMFKAKDKNDDMWHSYLCEHSSHSGDRLLPILSYRQSRVHSFNRMMIAPNPLAYFTPSSGQKHYNNNATPQLRYNHEHNHNIACGKGYPTLQETTRYPTLRETTRNY